MKITVLGSGSAFSSLSRFNSCYLVEVGSRKFMIDCGSDAMRAMQKAGVDFLTVDSVFITHMHADHSAGLPAVLTAMHVIDRKKPLEVYIPYTQLDFARLWLANMFIYSGRFSFEVSLLPLKDGKIDFGNGIEMEFIPTRHLEKYSEHAVSFGINAVSFSVVVREGAKSFYFSGDLASLEETRGHLESGVSFVEATHPPLGEVAALSANAGGGMYFTHIPMELEEGGEWREKLAAKYGIKELKSVRDGQVIVL